jgi:hypothetical protein
MYQPALHTYINICLQIATYITKLCNSFPSLSLLTFDNHFTFLATHNKQLRSHSTACLMCSISLSTLRLHYKIAQLICFSFIPHGSYLTFYQIKFVKRRSISKASKWSRELLARHMHPKAPKHSEAEVLSN